MARRFEGRFYLDWARRADKLEVLARQTVGVLRSHRVVAVQKPYGRQEDGDYAKP